MHRLEKWIKKLSIRKKIIFYSYAAIIPILLIICIIVGITSYEKQVNDQIERSESAIRIVENNLAIVKNEVLDLVNYITINEEVLAILKSSDPQTLNQDTRLWAHQASIQMVEDILAIKGYVKTVAIYPKNGVQPYLRCTDASVCLPTLDVMKQTDTYKEAVSSRGSVVWKAVTDSGGDVYLANRDGKIVACREIYDLRKKTPLGYLVVGMRDESVSSLCQDISVDEEESAIIFTARGDMLASAGEIDEKILEYLCSEEFLSQDYKERKEYFDRGAYTIFCEQSSNSGEIICKIMPRISKMSVFYEVAYIPLFLMLGVLIGLLPVLLFVSDVVCRPLGNVCEGMEKFRQGDFGQRVEVDTEDEIGAVSACFNTMVEDIKTLIDKNYVITLREKESELAALQAQINPHFLYNTLDTLYWQATGEGSDEVAENILALSQLFRLVLNQGKKEVTVGQEVELVSRYLQIQKVRFGERLNYEINVEDEAKRARIPKLILQPFVENAIVHGFENIQVPCYLKVAGKVDGDMLQFIVQDTGIGMRQDQIDAIWEEETEQYARQRVGRFAIKNIRERLHLRYQDNFELEIRSSVGHGTTVVVRVPFEREDISVY